MVFDIVGGKDSAVVEGLDVKESEEAVIVVDEDEAELLAFEKNKPTIDSRKSHSRTPSGSKVK